MGAVRSGIFKFFPFFSTFFIIAFVASGILLFKTSSADTGGAGWDLTFSDEFNGTSLNTNVWTPELTWGYNGGSSEIEGYAPDDVIESGGQLHLKAENRTLTLGGTTYNYTSGMIQSSGHFNQAYGYFEMRAQVPAGDGYWPAFWTLPDTSGAAQSEIDALEISSLSPQRAYMTLHWGYNSQSAQGNWDSSSALSSSGFHVYAVDWEPGVITWYIDGVQRWQYQSANVPSAPMYLLADLAIGAPGSWVGTPDASTPFPSTMDIDYIRVYQKVSSGACYASIPGPNDPIPSTICPVILPPTPPPTPTSTPTSTPILPPTPTSTPTSTPAPIPAPVPVPIPSPVPTYSTSYDNQPPTILITNPSASSTLSGVVTLSADAADNVGVVYVDFLLNNSILGVPIANAPYTMSWDTRNTPNGRYLLSAQAYDGAGNRGIAPEIFVTIANGVANSTSPVVSSPSPAASGGGTPTTPSSYVFTRNLSIGSRGSDVIALQEFLFKDGDYPADIVTGYYGALTVAAVKSFQVRYGIINYGNPSTTGFGSVGPRTRAKINGLGG